MLYNLSEFITQIKENIEIGDIRLPVDDTVIRDRFLNSALKEFSVRCPHVTEIFLSECHAVNPSMRNIIDGSVKYIIPEMYYKGTTILSVLGINPGGYGSAANMYMPSVVLGSADMVLESIAEIKMAAALGSTMCHAPTFRFEKPNILFIYNGWTATAYRVEVAMLHDPSLATVPDTAFTHLLELARLDIQAFLYGKMKRKGTINTPVGDFDLALNAWENSAQEKRDLLKEWDETGALDLDRINYF